MFRNSAIAGTFSNMAGTLAGHPLDTIRVSCNECLIILCFFIKGPNDARDTYDYSKVVRL